MERDVGKHSKGGGGAVGALEFEFLCRAVGCALGCPPLPVPPLRREAVNQARLIDLAMRHRGLPLLAAGLERGRREGLPAWLAMEPEGQARLTRSLAVGAGRAVFLARRLVALLDDFADSGLRAMALKGPAMAQMLYGHIDYRPSDDLDIWVHSHDFAKACGIMETLGYTPLISLSPLEAQSHMRAGWDRGFRSPVGDYVVELCTGMAPRYFARLPDADVFWDGSTEMAFEGRVIRTPAAGPLLELLCLHGMKHGWSRLLWVADIAALAGLRTGIDWVVLGRQTRVHGTERMTALGLRLACVSLGADIHWEPVSPGLERCATRLLSGVESCPGFRNEMLFHLAGRERLRDRIRYIVLAFFTPSFGDWRSFDLPRSLFSFHWILRPFRLMVGLVKRHRKRKQSC